MKAPIEVLGVEYIEVGDFAAAFVSAVLVDDVVVERVVSANIKEGWVVAYVYPYLICKGEAVRKRIHGKVTIEWKL